MKKMTKAMLMTALILGSVSVGTAVEAKELNTFALDEYVVTATRTLKEIQEVPASVSVITAQDIEKKNATSVREALKGLPGIYVEPTTMSTMSNGIQMRGFTDNNILVFIDGVQVNTSYAGVADLNQLAVDNIERIEVVRGAASSIYGGYAVGGVINITTKEAKNIGTTGEAVVTYGSNDTWKKSINVNSKVNDKWSFGLGYEKSESDGYVSSLITKEASSAVTGAPSVTLDKLDNGYYLVGERSKKSWFNENYNFNIKYNFDDSKSLKYTYVKTDYETKYGRPTLYASLDSNGKANIAGTDKGISLTPRNIFGTDNFFERDTHGLVYNDTDNRFKVQASYVDNKVDGHVLPKSAWDKDLTLNFFGNGEYNAHPSEVFDLNVEKAWENIGKHTIVAGMSYKKEEMNQDKLKLSNWKDKDSITELYGQDIGEVTNFAVFLQDEYKINEPWTMYVGARVDYFKKGSGRFWNNSTKPKFDKTTESESYTEVSPKIAFDYKADENTNYYVSYGHSFNAPPMYQIYRSSLKGKNPVKFYFGNPELEPETSDTFEIGMKKNLSEKTNLDVSFYHITTDNKIGAQAPQRGTVIVDDVEYPRHVYENSDEEKRHGIEVALNHKFSDKYSTYINYAWQQGDISIKDKYDEDACDIPTHLLHAGIAYDDGKWNALLECEYMSERNIMGYDYNGPGSQEALFLVNTAFNYKINEDMTLQFGINNLFDKIYYCKDPIDERSYYVGLRYKF